MVWELRSGEWIREAGTRQTTQTPTKRINAFSDWIECQDFKRPCDSTRVRRVGVVDVFATSTPLRGNFGQLPDQKPQHVPVVAPDSWPQLKGWPAFQVCWVRDPLAWLPLGY